MSDGGSDSSIDDTSGVSVYFGYQRRGAVSAFVVWPVLTALSLALGGMLCAAAFAMLAYNELSDAERAGSLDSGARLAVTVSADRVDPQREGALVHVTGMAVAHGEVVDPDIGVSASGIKLFRSVEMYQWVETRTEEDVTDNEGRRKRVVRHTYAPHWRQSWLDSRSFQGPQPPSNPPSMPYLNAQWQAEHVSVGAFRLTPRQVDRVGSREPLDLSRFAPTRQVAAGTLVRHGNVYYLGRDPADPQVGDMRISYAVSQPGPVSILAAQSGSGFAPYERSMRLPTTRSLLMFVTPSIGQIDELENGTLSKDTMVRDTPRRSSLVTWALRLVGALMMVLGVKFIVWPCVGLLSVMPTVRRVFARGTGYVSLRLGVGLSVITCIFAWVTARGLADDATAQHAATAAAVIFLAWVASEPLRRR